MLWWVEWYQLSLIETVGVVDVLGEGFLPEEVLEIETLFAV